jgi:hypothetical protein
VAAALLFQLLTLVQPPLLVGGVLVMALAGGLWWRAGERPQPRLEAVVSG